MPARKRRSAKHRTRRPLSHAVLALVLFTFVLAAYVALLIYRQFIDLPGPAGRVLDAATLSGRVPPLILASILFGLTVVFIAYIAAIADGVRRTSITRSLAFFATLTLVSTAVFSAVAMFLMPQDEVAVFGRTVNEWELAAFELRVAVDAMFVDRPAGYWDEYRELLRTTTENALTTPNAFESPGSPLTFQALVLYFLQDALRLLVFFGDLSFFTFSQVKPNSLAAEALVVVFRIATLALVAPVLLDAWRLTKRRSPFFGKKKRKKTRSTGWKKRR